MSVYNLTHFCQGVAGSLSSARGCEAESSSLLGGGGGLKGASSDVIDIDVAVTGNDAFTGVGGTTGIGTLSCEMTPILGRGGIGGMIGGAPFGIATPLAIRW